MLGADRMEKNTYTSKDVDSIFLWMTVIFGLLLIAIIAYYQWWLMPDFGDTLCSKLYGSYEIKTSFDYVLCENGLHIKIGG